MKPRLQDVAVRAGVSMKTVSNVINDFAHVSESTREKVLAAIAETGYQPNLTARNLARGRSGMIALVVPQVDMPYFASLTRHVLQTAQEHSLTVLIHQTLDDLDQERRILQGGLPQRIDGLVFSPRRVTPAEIEARADRTPLVLLGDLPYRGIADHVVIDNALAAEEAVSHLIGLPRRRIAMVGAAWDDEANPRYVGYRRALEHHGLAVDPRLVVPTPHPSGDHGEAAMTALLRRRGKGKRPDAVFCQTDWLALGVVRALHRHGLRVPEDVAVLGWDDIPYGRASTPTLTTVSPGREAVARAALEALLEQQEGRTTPVETVLPHRLIVRESTVGADATPVSPGRV